MRLPAQRLALDRDPKATALKVQRYSSEGVQMNARWLSRPCPKCRGILATGTARRELSGMPRSVRVLINLLLGCEAVPIKMFLLALFA